MRIAAGWAVAASLFRGVRPASRESAASEVRAASTSRIVPGNTAAPSYSPCSSATPASARIAALPRPRGTFDT